MKLLSTQVNDAARRRTDGFLAAFRAVAQEQGTHWEIERDDLELLNREWPIQIGRPIPATELLPATPPAIRRQAPPPPQPWALSPFGIMARTLKLLRAPEDVGVGDTLARIVGPIGGDAYKKWYLETFGKSCGCTERQQTLNELFPYEKKP
jgi:hypothetical protein